MVARTTGDRRRKDLFEPRKIIELCPNLGEMRTGDLAHLGARRPLWLS
jgi:hypothetical protein